MNRNFSGSTGMGYPASIGSSILPFDDNISLLLEVIQDGVFILDKDLRIEYCNPAARQHIKDSYGFDCNKGDLIIPLLPPARQPILQKYFSHILQGQSVCYQHEIIKHHGPSFWIECAYFPLKNDTGEVVAIGGTLKDITERINYKAALIRKSEELTSILESITDGFFTLDRHRIIRYANRQAAAMVSLTTTQVIGRDIRELFPHTSAAGFMDAYERAFETGETVTFEGNYAPMNIWLEMTIYPSTELLTVYVRDVMEKRRSEQLLREMNFRYELVSKATSGVIWDIAVGSDQTYWHGDNMKKVFGHDMVNSYHDNRDWPGLIHPKDRERVLETYQRRLLNDHENWSEEFWFRKADGEYAFVKDRGYIVRDENGKAIRMIGAMEDITAQKKAEEALLKLKLSKQKLIIKATLHGQEKERELISAELHDNINQILTTTKLYLEMAHDREEYRLDLIRKSEENIMRTINEIRFLCKSLIPSTIKDIGIADSIQELVESYRLTQRFNIEFIHSGPLDQFSSGFKVNLFRIVQEQLNNIGKYTEAKNVQIRLVVRRNLSVSICDDGKGFDLSVKASGIGLTNIRNRTELYDGRAEVVSEPGKGCEVRLAFPLSACKR